MSRRLPIIVGDIAYLQLTQGYVTVIDAVDAELVSDRNWVACVRERGVYAASGTGGAYVRLHRHLMGATGSTQIDHINGLGLDNRRANLRSATQNANAHNRKLRADSAVGFKGVQRLKQPGIKIYRARIAVDGKRRVVGHFATPEEAARAYDAAARQCHGEFACLNFPLPHERGARA